MADIVVEVLGAGERREYELGPAGARIAAPGAVAGPGEGLRIPVPGARGELEVRTGPPLLLHLAGERPEVAGRPLEELALEDATVVDWCGVRLLFRVSEPVIEELTPPPAEAPGPAPAEPAGQEGWERLAAGMLVELGLADRAATRRWQQAVIAGEYDAGECARDLLDSSGVALDDPRLVERAGRLQRDLLMIRFQTGVRGAGRRARRAARGGVAFLVSQLVAIGVYTLILVAIVLLLRVKNDFSLDATIDSWLDLLSSGR